MKSKSPRLITLREILVNALLIFCAVTVVGTISNVVILLVGWITSLPVTASLDAQGYSQAEQQTVWLFYAILAMTVCVICSFAVTMAVGSRAAQYRVGYGQPRHIGILTPLATVGLALAVHGLHCVILADLSMAYLVIASPVQYIARFLGKGENTIFIEDAFDFGMEYVWAAIGIYLAFLALSCGAAYIAGFYRRIREVEKKEKEDASAARYEERKARLEAEGRGGVSNTQPEWKPEIKRETLSKRTEERLRELNRAKIVHTVIFILAWMAVDVLLWYLWSKSSGREMLSPSAIFFTILLVIPFWPMKKYEIFLGKTYYAEVAEIKVVERTEISSAKTGKRTRVMTYRIVYLRPKGGASEKLEFKEKEMLSFDVGDHVLKLSAFRYPVNCNFDDVHDVYCPNCGHSNVLGRKRCGGCGYKLGREK
ncbi:MAG: zinc ribbon domain-containing protein [Ruminococcaceae bacterium]|nr:zinc ribbon domain-containing protein [Oscillospiraceae bacterium]